MRTAVETTLYEKKVKFRLEKTLKALGNSICLLSGILLLWVVISWVDVVGHNLEENATQLMLSWNFFVVCFSKPHMDYNMLNIITITVFLIIQLIMPDGRMKRMCGLLLMLIMTVLSVLLNSWTTWVFVPAVSLSIWREFNIISRKN